MKGHPVVLLTLVSMALATGPLVAMITGRAVAPGAVSTVAHVQTGLANHPQLWIGRALQVRGMAEPCPWWGRTARLWQCANDPLILVAAATDRVSEPLPLSQPAPSGILTLVRALPLLHDLAPRSQAVPLFRAERFRVQVRALDARACGGRSPCYEAVLRNAAVALP